MAFGSPYPSRPNGSASEIRLTPRLSSLISAFSRTMHFPQVIAKNAPSPTGTPLQVCLFGECDGATLKRQMRRELRVGRWHKVGIVAPLTLPGRDMGPPTATRVFLR